MWSADGYRSDGSDAFSALLADLHELHKREVADLKAEIGLLRSTACMEQAGSCVEHTGAWHDDAELARAKEEVVPAAEPALDSESEPRHQHANAACSLDTTPAADQHPEEAVGPNGVPPAAEEHSAEPVCPNGVSCKAQSLHSQRSLVFSAGSAFRRATHVIPRFFASTEKAPAGLAAIRKRPSQIERIDRSSASSFLSSLVKQSWFEAFFCLAIFLNACMVALEVQFHGSSIREGLWNTSADTADKHVVAHSFIDVFSWMFGILFALEVVVKFLGLRAQFGLDYWNWIDLTVCVAWAFSKLEGDYLPVNSQVLRLFRLARLIRLMRLVRTIQGFDNLFIMTTAIKGSLSVLIWMCVLLSLMQMVTALFLIQYLHEEYFDLSAPPDSDFMKKQQEVYMYFGTFTRAFFTTFEMTLANWPPACRVLAENVSEWFFVFAVFYKLSIGFAVIGVVNGIFIQETFRVASIDDNIMMRQKARAIQAHREKMTQLFEEADGIRDNKRFSDGQISREEWIDIVNDEQVKLWLASMELVAADAEKLFDLLDETRDGYISFEELTMGVARLRGNARSIDLQVLMSEQQRLSSLLDSGIMAALSKPTRPFGAEPTASFDKARFGTGDRSEETALQAVASKGHRHELEGKARQPTCTEDHRDLLEGKALQAVTMHDHRDPLEGKALQAVATEDHRKPKDLAEINNRHMAPPKGVQRSMTVPASSPAFGTKVLHTDTLGDHSFNRYDSL